MLNSSRIPAECSKPLPIQVPGSLGCVSLTKLDDRSNIVSIESEKSYERILELSDSAKHSFQCVARMTP